MYTISPDSVEMAGGINQDGNDRTSQNVGTELPFDAAQKSLIRRRKTEITSRFITLITKQ
jgi:hypothetical protein